jgi:sugar phosphate isomerase/epimerase
MRPVSVQLYTLREAMALDAATTLARLAAMGFELVEPYQFVDDPTGAADELRAAGLSAPSAHARFVGQDQDRIFAAAAKLGVGTLIEPVSDKALWHSLDGVRHLADELNEAARRASDHGLALGYHNHSFEYDGGLSAPLERLAEALDDDVVLEVDTYWAAVGGDDPAALLTRLGDRVGFLHVKDGPITMETLDQVALGDGAMPVPAILDAAPHALAVVELDDCRTDMLTAVERSLGYLRSLA